MYSWSRPDRSWGRVCPGAGGGSEPSATSGYTIGHPIPGDDSAANWDVRLGSLCRDASHDGSAHVRGFTQPIRTYTNSTGVIAAGGSRVRTVALPGPDLRLRAERPN